jgi:hypothetical protein
MLSGVEHDSHDNKESPIAPNQTWQLRATDPTDLRLVRFGPGIEAWSGSEVHHLARFGVRLLALGPQGRFRHLSAPVVAKGEGDAGNQGRHPADHYGDPRVADVSDPTN